MTAPDGNSTTGDGAGEVRARLESRPDPGAAPRRARRVRMHDLHGARVGALYGATVAATDARRAAAGVGAARSGLTAPRYFPSRRSWAWWGLGNVYRTRGDRRPGSGI